MQNLPARRSAVDSFVVFDADFVLVHSSDPSGLRYMVFPVGLNKFGNLGFLVFVYIMIPATWSLNGFRIVLVCIMIPSNWSLKGLCIFVLKASTLNKLVSCFAFNSMLVSTVKWIEKLKYFNFSTNRVECTQRHLVEDQNKQNLLV